jgi:uncharacterized membrane-anchored protein
MAHLSIAARSRRMSIRLDNKVPQVTLIFWIIKILSTTVSETGAGYLAVHAGLGTAWTGAMMGMLLLLALLYQLRQTRYIPWVYWLTVVLLSVVGTQIIDALTNRLGVSLYASTAVFSALLAAVFGLWYQLERTLEIEAIVTRRRELLYWAAILLTFALGTATGDLATEELSLGFRLGVVAFGGLIAIIYGARLSGANQVLAFWLAYILTRPLGGALGDLLSQSPDYGGVGWGTVNTSAAFLTVIAVSMASLRPWTRRRLPAADFIGRKS